jgi:hypothetical protein
MGTSSISLDYIGLSHRLMTSYHGALSEFKNIAHDDADDDGDHQFGCGEWAALLSHSVQAEAVIVEGSQTSKDGNKETSLQDPVQNQNQGGTPADGVPILHPEATMEGWSRSSTSSTIVSEQTPTENRGGSWWSAVNTPSAITFDRRE